MIFQWTVSCLTSAMKKEKLTEAIENDCYIKKLINLFHICEDLNNIEGLHYLFDIFRNLILLNKNALFEVMFSGNQSNFDRRSGVFTSKQLYRVYFLLQMI